MHHHSVISRSGGCPRLRVSSGDVLRDGDSGGEPGTRGGCRLVGGIGLATSLRQGSQARAPRSVRPKKEGPEPGTADQGPDGARQTGAWPVTAP